MTRSFALLLPSDRLECRHAAAPRAWTELLLGERCVVFHPVGLSECNDAVDDCSPKVLFSGSFNPLHEGHVRMAQIAGERLGGPVWLELSITNVDKPPLDFFTIRERLERLTEYNVCLTRAATFAEKAELFPRATFVVGADTLCRIADERYYHGRKEERDAAIARLADTQARFLVFGRTCQGQFLTPAGMLLPPRLTALCEGVSEAEFRDDISSSELRTEQSP